MLQTNTNTTTTIMASMSQGGTHTSSGAQAHPAALTSSKSQALHRVDSADPREDYTTKSKAAAARWSGSERKIAKSRQQGLDQARRKKAAALGVFDLGITPEENATEDALGSEGEVVEGEFVVEDDTEEEDDFIREDLAEQDFLDDVHFGNEED
jgi:hypothetical protein